MIWLLGGYMWLFVHRPFEYWPLLGSLQLERVYMLVMLLTWIVAPGKGGLWNRIHVALTVFTLVLAAAWVVSPYADIPGCLDVVENYFKVTVFYILVVTTVRTEKALRQLVLLYLLAVGLYMSHSILEFLNGRYQWRMGIRRMIGVDITFSDPNAFASTLLYTLPMLLPFWYERPRWLPRFLLLGYGAALVGCILLTGSRAGFVGLIVFAFLVLVLSVRQKVLVGVVGGVIGCLMLVVLSVALPEELQNRYLTLVDSSRGPQNAAESAAGRMDGFLFGLEVWQQSPLLGRGPASFGFATGRGGQAHNLYGQVLSEMGLLGALALLGLVVCFVWNWVETRRLYKQPGIAPVNEQGQPVATDMVYLVARSVMINVLLLLIMGWAGHNLYRYNWQWFAAFGAISLHCLRVRAAAAAQARSYALPYLILPWSSAATGTVDEFR
jgi:O-antigen ligase